MKHFKHLLLLGLLSGAALAAPALKDVALVSPNVAWGSSQAGVYRSTDGGQNWHNLTPDLRGDRLQGAFFLDADHAWLTATAPYDAKGQALRPTRVLRTSDGGKHWKSVALFPRGGAGIKFTDARSGTALVELGAATGHTAFVLLTTRDAGATWHKVNSAEYGYMPDPELKGGTLPDVSGPNAFTLLPRFGVLTGIYGPLDQPYLFITHDGGHSFQEGAGLVPYTPQEKQTAARTNVVWASGDWARLSSLSQPAAGASALRIFWTQDAGKTWKGSAALNLPPRSRAAVNFSDWAHGWLWVQGSDEQFKALPTHLYRTSNGGKDWRDLGAMWQDEDLPTASFFGDQFGLALRYLGDQPRELWRTADGGQTWQRLP